MHHQNNDEMIVFMLSGPDLSHVNSTSCLAIHAVKQSKDQIDFLEGDNLELLTWTVLLIYF